MTNTDEIETDEQEVQTQEGRGIRLSDALEMVGGDLNKAHGVMFFVGLGVSVPVAATAASIMSAKQARAQANTGSGSYAVNELIANLLDTSEVQADTLSGDVVGRAEPVDYIAGNFHNDSSRPSSPEDNDVLFYRGGSP